MVQVVTDNASNCRRMGALLEADYPSIVWTPCASHCLDLLMEDVGKIDWVKEMVQQATSVVTFFTAKTKVLACYRNIEGALELKKPSSTRFAYMWVLMERLHRCKDFIRLTIFSVWWNNEWEERDTDEVKDMQRLCCDNNFWSGIQALVIAMTPFDRILQMIDMKGATISLLVHFMHEAIADFRSCPAISEEKRDQIMVIVNRRWRWMRRPIHGLTALLHPAYKSPALFTDIELLEDRDAFMPKIVPEDEQGTFLEELISYNDQRGGAAFASPTCWKRESLVKPLFWWETFGYAHRSLQKVALRLLAQDCSSGACERNWSSYSLIHTKIRNRLSTRQLERLVYCRHNLRMLRAMQSMQSAKQVYTISILLPLGCRSKGVLPCKLCLKFKLQSS